MEFIENPSIELDKEEHASSYKLPQIAKMPRMSAQTWAAIENGLNPSEATYPKEKCPRISGKLGKLKLRLHVSFWSRRKFSSGGRTDP